MAEIIQDSHKFLVNTTLIAQWEDTLPYPTTRKIYRHESNEGSVIEFDMFGKKVKLFVADAKYRGTGTYGVDSDVELKAYNQDDKLIMASQPTAALSSNLTDAELQARFPSFSTVETAKVATSYLYSRNQAGTAAYFCRSKSISGVGTLDIPNIYELMVIFLESDNIDSLDPAASTKQNFMLGFKATNGRFDFNGSNIEPTGIVSCTYGKTGSPRIVNNDGDCTFGASNSGYGVIPVKELSIA